MRPNYLLGPGDMVQIRVLEVEEIGDRPFRVESTGEINLPLVGPVTATGLTVDQLQAELNQRLKRFVVNPQASVILVQFRSDPVFFVGAFRLPGIYPLTGRRTLVEMLTIAGG
ncbi:MAG: polysaccharide export protein, partial [Verrucomicrobia bacterium]|nr:polysaccharide export protein [Verrucomicrobiota bacterium]